MVFTLRRSVFLVAFVALWQWVAGKVELLEAHDRVIIKNGYTYLVFNKHTSSIEKIEADFSGSGTYGNNNLARPFSLQVRESDKSNLGVKCAESDELPPVEVSILENTETSARFKVSNVFDRSFSGCGPDGNGGNSDPVVSEEWIISLAADKRSVTVDIAGQVLRDASVDYVLHGIYTTSPSLYGLFPEGVLQMMGNTDACMGSAEPLSRAYVLGNGAALDVVRHNYNESHVFNSDAIEPATGSPSTVVFKSAHSTFASGIEDVVFGTYPTISDKMSKAWSRSCWAGTIPTKLTSGAMYAFGLTFLPNNYDFPAYLLNDVTTSSATVPFDQLRAYLTGAYASPAGCLQSYYNLQGGTIAPTIAHPDVGYSPDTNFFDPDNFISLTALLYSGDTYFIRQVKDVLSRTAETMCGIGKDQVAEYCNQTVAQIRVQQQHQQQHQQQQQQQQHGGKLDTDKDTMAWARHRVQVGRPHKLHSTSRFQYHAGGDDGTNTRTGQLMHHFVNLVPTYESIAGSEQLGPNIFWTFAVLNYVALTQDTDFANAMFPYVDLSTKYVLSFYDAEKALFRAPGPLWIDVIVRENYTSDSNAMLVPYLKKVADFYDYLHIDADFATELRQLSDTVAASIRTVLFDTDLKDHFITQLNPDGSIRDFVDYDANLMTVAFGIITDDAQIHRVLKRVDSGPYTHVRGTWCSEVPYSGDAPDCYIVGGNVCGDSIVTLARIGWIDALARKRIGDLKTFQQLLLEPLQQDLLRDVWLYERYDANGTQIRTPYYFEYPSLVVMMLREVQYGIDIALDHVNIDPFPHAAYKLSLGLVSVDYAPERVVLSLPGASAHASAKAVNIGGMVASAAYRVTNTCAAAADRATQTVTANEGGVLSFSTTFATGCTVTATLQQ